MSILIGATSLVFTAFYVVALDAEANAGPSAVAGESDVAAEAEQADQCEFACGDDEGLVRPEGWPEDEPLPTVNSNCTRCHLTAGRELTAAVVHFTRSAHDINELTCNDCHGGNTEDDITAHDDEFDFIGTKLSTHIATCADCHYDEAEEIEEGPHAWDWSERINLEYPTCIDCHGNHDVGNPAGDLTLLDVCYDCHDDFEEDFPGYAQVVEANDEYWQTMMRVRRHNRLQADPIPEEFVDDVAELRTETMELFHHAGKLADDRAAALADKTDRMREALAAWLEEQ